MKYYLPIGQMHLGIDAAMRHSPPFKQSQRLSQRSPMKPLEHLKYTFITIK